MARTCRANPPNGPLLALERMGPEEPFEEVLDSCSELLRGMARGVQGRPKGVHLASLLRTLTVRYARYVRETFGTRLSPGLGRVLGTGEGTGGRSEGRQKGKRREEARQQARFLGQVVGLAFLLREGDGSRPHVKTGNRPPDRPSLVPVDSGQSIPRIQPDGITSPWAALWIRLAVIDLIGCGPFLDNILKRRAFREGFRSMVPRKAWSRLSRAIKESDDASSLATVVRSTVATLQDDLFPSHGDTGEAWLPGLPIPPWEMGEDAPQAWLEKLSTAWLYILVALDVELLRYRHIRETVQPGNRQPGDHDPGSREHDGVVHRELMRLWDLTARTFRGWMWARKNGIAGASTGFRVALMREVLAGRPPSNGTSIFRGGTGTANHRCFHLSIDSLWLQMYLVESITRNMDLVEIIRDHFPDRHLAVVFLRRFAALGAHLLWSLLREEESGGDLPLPELPRAISGTTEGGDGERNRPGARSVHAPSPGAGRASSGQLVFGRGVAPVGIEEYTDALIEMVDVYTHNIIELPFEIHVGRFLRWFLESQGPLYLLKPHYRDHLYHVIDVFLLGDFLLGCRLGRERSRVRDVLETLLERAAVGADGNGKDETATVTFPDLRKNWCVAGLFHDMGYPMLLHRELAGKEPESLVGETLQQFVRQIRNAFQGKAEELEQRIREAFSELHENEAGAATDHGVLSALMVRDHMRRIQWPASERRLVEEFEPALTAIYLHNLQNRVVRIQDAPLTYLLAFCDEVQDWGRRKVAPDGVSRDVTWAITDPANWQLRSVPVLGDLRLVVEGVSGHDVVLPGPAGETVPSPGRRGDGVGAGEHDVVIEMYQVYRPTSTELLNPLFLWISKAQNLERLDARDAPWRPRLVLVTAVPRHLQRMELTYLELLSRISGRAEELNLQRFVHHLIRLRRETQEAWRRGATRGATPPVSPALGGLDGHEWDWVVLDQRRLAEDLPLRSFGTTAGARRLLEVEQQVIREATERYRYQARSLWPLATRKA